MNLSQVHHIRYVLSSIAEPRFSAHDECDSFLFYLTFDSALKLTYVQKLRLSGTLYEAPGRSVDAFQPNGSGYNPNAGPHCDSLAYGRSLDGGEGWPIPCDFVRYSDGSGTGYLLGCSCDRPKL